LSSAFVDDRKIHATEPARKHRRDRKSDDHRDSGPDPKDNQQPQTRPLEFRSHKMLPIAARVRRRHHGQRRDPL
jgi:hypothetical protein